MEQVVLIRYGEIGLRGKNRPWFEDILRDRIKSVLADLGNPKVWRSHGRFYVQVTGQLAQILERLHRVFGIVSVSPALKVPLTMPDIEAAGLALARPFGEGAAAAGRTVPFRAEARRANKAFPATSMEINRALGDLLLQELPALKVDLHRPELVLSVEVRDDAAYVYTDTVSGLGGLPYGSGGKALLLLSGGIDSPVAGWMSMRRGVEIEAIHFHTPPFTSPRAKEKVVDICRVLAGWGNGRLRLHLVHFTEVQKALTQHCPEDLTITLMRRFMLRIAARLAEREGALALATGESVGQVASQTLESMNTINAVTEMPVLRPLVALDKVDIVRRAREIGSYEISVRPYEDCCTVFVPRNPKTRPRREQAAAAEAALPVADLVQAAVSAVETVVITAGDANLVAGRTG